MTPRTSFVRTGGMSDNTAEKVTMYGTSSDGINVTLSDVYNSLNENAPPARFPTSDAVVKEAKYTTAFPDIMMIPFSANSSAVFGSFGTEPDSGTYVDTPRIDFKNPHNIMCGLLYLEGYILPENTLTHIQDEYYLTLNWEIEIGPSLAKNFYSRRLKSKYKKRGGRKYRSRRKWYRR